MTTKSQEVFIQTQQVYASLKSCKPELTNFFFHAGIEYGRKQALEEAIAICRTPIDEIQCTGSISELVYPDCDDIALKLQELIK